MPNIVKNPVIELNGIRFYKKSSGYYIANKKYLISIKNKGKRKGNNSPHAKKIYCITTNEIFNSIENASKQYNINRNCISACCCNKQKLAGHLQWRYIDAK